MRKMHTNQNLIVSGGNIEKLSLINPIDSSVIKLPNVPRNLFGYVE